MGHVLDLLVGSVAAIRSVAHQVHFSSTRFSFVLIYPWRRPVVSTADEEHTIYPTPEDHRREDLRIL